MDQQIGRYEIRRELGRGGMATVYLALDPNIRRQVAIKVLPRQFTHDPKYLARFRQEAETIAALEHPAIVPVYDFGEHNDAPFLVMRYMSGGTLGDRLQGDPLPLEMIAAMLERLAPALDYAHEGGVIHRDLKPANILFDHQGNTYLADFGIARLAEASQTMTMIGTPAYMSPEQVEGTLKLDSRSDIYALGVLLYEMLAGKPPYTAETPTGQMLMHITKPVPDVLISGRDLPPGTQEVINKAMAKDREERYQTAAELAAAVNTLLALERTAESAPVTPPIAVVPAVGAHPGEPDIEEVILPAADAFLEAADEELAADTEHLAVAEEAAFPETEVDRVAPEGIDDTSRPFVEGNGQVPPPEIVTERRALPIWVWGFLGLAVLVTAGLGARFILQDNAAEETAEEEELTADADLLPLDAAPGDTWDRELDSMTMVYVSDGSFEMGSEDGDDDERPVHEVSLHAFWIDHTEVTNDQFEQFVEATGYETTAQEEEGSGVFIGEELEWVEGAYWQHPRGPDSSLDDLADHPVVQISWLDAGAYCEWVGGRLPTEAEWEYAARGPEGWIYPWGNSFDGEEANFCDANCPLKWADEAVDDGYEFTAPADSDRAGESWSGVRDLSGNVSEWVNDWYDENYYYDSPEHNPQGPDSSDFKVLRGGSWRYNEYDLRSTTRVFDYPFFRSDYIGFRCVVSPGI